MSKLMLIAGILLVAVAIALGLMIFFSPGSVVGWGITSEFAALLLVGGVIALGLGGVISALEAGAAPLAHTSAAVTPGQTETVIPEFGRRTAQPVPAMEEISPAVDETIKALEDAKTGIRQAFGDEPETPVAEPENEPPAEQISEADETSTGTGDQLYVVEERAIRNRPARILSDGTVEAETDEGWMRFENLEHLDEYLDAMAPSIKA
ncbi:MAG: hypothetical protein H7X89_15235 [Rhizobiales bacterium]|nr:hypothetical protein [Hyphomicrobiales bacterium]